MDRKAYIVLIVSFLLFISSSFLANRLFPPVPANTNSVAFATNRFARTNGLERIVASTNAVSGSAKASSATAATGPVNEETLTVENPVAIYTFTSKGGGIKEIALKDYPAVIDRNTKGGKNTNNLARLNDTAPLAAFAILGGEAVEGDGNFKLSLLPGGTGVRAEKGLPNGLTIVKEFQPGTNYVMKSSVHIENHSEQPVSIPDQEWVVGTATPLGTRNEALRLGSQWYNGSKAEFVGESWFMNRTLGCLPGTPRSLYDVQSPTNVVWTAVHNQFFVLITTPSQPASRFVTRHVNLPPPKLSQVPADSKAITQHLGYQAGIVYPAATIRPNEGIVRNFEIYAGPKEYNTLARLPHNEDLAMNFGYTGFFAKGLLLAMNGLHALGIAYGLAIVVITVIIKLFFWPLTTASTRSMKRMSALQPQMKAIQEKYKDDPRKMNMKLMEFMKEHKVSPLGGCLPMFIQVPVFIGFYTMLQSAIELRGAHFLWAYDLSQADTIFMLPLGVAHIPINPMPLLMGVTMLWQARMTPPSPGMDPAQQKIMKYMPLMFMVFLYNMSAGLTLYWTVQNLLTITQMKLTRASDPSVGSTAKPVGPAVKGPVFRKKK